jgi:hypothetical protein
LPLFFADNLKPSREKAGIELLMKMGIGRVDFVKAVAYINFLS